MVIHWESSKRPLYVKTIWKDGQHHVVLRQEDDVERLWPTGKNVQRSNQNSARVIKSAASATTPNLNVTSFTLSRTFSCEAKVNVKSRRCKTSVKCPETPTTPKQPLRNTSRAETVSQKSNKTLNLSIKSNSIDLNDVRNDTLENATYYLNRCNFTDSYNNSLTEKVMVWLDLAIQNGDYDKEIKIEPKRIVTAYPATKKIYPRISKQESLPAHNSEFRIDGVSQAFISGNYDIFDRGEAVDVLEQPVISSEVEEHFVMDGLTDGSDFRNKVGPCKRQLHIFMPDLPKKFSDCDSSILSSKMSNDCTLPNI